MGFTVQGPLDSPVMICFSYKLFAIIAFFVRRRILQKKTPREITKFMQVGVRGLGLCVIRKRSLYTRWKLCCVFHPSVWS